MRLFTGYNPTKLKTHLKMAITRLQISNNKKSALTKQQIREIATLLAETPPKEEKARIKAEALIRDDNTVEACEILALTCELLSERIALITHSNDCPPDLISSISTLLWASGVVDVPELIEIRKQFRFKWGKEFEMDAVQNVGGVINERVAAKLSVQPPSAYLVQMYLERIAEEHQVQWKPKQVLTAENMAEPMVPPVGYSVPVGAASGLKPGEYHVSTAAAVSQGQNASAPPFSPSYAVPPMAPTNASVASSSLSSQQQRPYVPVLPITPTSPSGLDDDEEEGDIYVPAMFRSRGGNTDATNNNNETLSSRGRTQSAGEDSRGFDVTSGGDDGTGGNGAVEESYDDLAARFAELQRSSVMH